MYDSNEYEYEYEPDESYDIESLEDDFEVMNIYGRRRSGRPRGMNNRYRVRPQSYGPRMVPRPRFGYRPRSSQSFRGSYPRPPNRNFPNRPSGYVSDGNRRVNSNMRSPFRPRFQSQPNLRDQAPIRRPYPTEGMNSRMYDKTKMACHYCKKLGHFYADCIKRRRFER